MSMALGHPWGWHSDLGNPITAAAQSRNFTGVSQHQALVI